MRFTWPEDLTEARLVQERLAPWVCLRRLRRTPRTVAGVDAAFSGDRISAAACLYSLPDLSPLEDAEASRPLDFPYIPGYLSYREGRAILEALAGLSQTPDLLLVDGQGIAHPRRFGIASFLGVLCGRPSIGCAKSRLVGDACDPGRRRGCSSRLVCGSELVGSVLRTRDGVRPVYVSPGHLIDVEGAVELVLEMTRGFRIPEPLRRAHTMSCAAAHHRHPVSIAACPSPASRHAGSSHPLSS